MVLTQPGALTRLWNEVQAAMQFQTTRQEFNTSLRCASLHSVERGVATIMVPNALIKEGIENRFIAPLRNLLMKHVGELVDVRVVLNVQRDGAGSVFGDVQESSALPPLASTTLPVPTGDLEGRPAWISAEQWSALSPMLRAGLIGSSLVAGEVQAKSLHLARLIRTRYAREVDELIAAALPSTPAPDQLQSHD
jgi:hypothetical protein